MSVVRTKTSTAEVATFQTLCTDLVCLIADMCDMRALFHLRLTCRALRTCLTASKYYPFRLLATTNVPLRYIMPVLASPARLSAVKHVVFGHAPLVTTCKHHECDEMAGGEFYNHSPFSGHPYEELVTRIVNTGINVTRLTLPICELSKKQLYQDNWMMTERITRLDAQFACVLGSSLNFVKRFPNLVHFSLLRFTVGSTVSHLTKHQDFPNIQNLDIEVVWINAFLTSVDLRCLIQACTNLQRLRLRVCQHFSLQRHLLAILDAIRDKRIPLFQMCGVLTSCDHSTVCSDSDVMCVQYRNYYYIGHIPESASLVVALNEESFTWNDQTYRDPDATCNYTNFTLLETTRQSYIGPLSGVPYERIGLPQIMRDDDFYRNPNLEVRCARLEISNHAAPNRPASTQTELHRCPCCVL
jgi:hypothetical protein